MMQIRFGFFAIMMIVAMFCSAGDVDVSFATAEGTIGDGAIAPAGWTYSSIGKSDNSAVFNKVGDYMRSPIYAYPLTNITIECKCSNAATTRFLRFIPLTCCGENITTNNDKILIFPINSDDEIIRNEKRTECIVLESELGINAFALELIGSASTGNWTVYSAKIWHAGPDSLKVATGLMAVDVTTNSFKAVWNPDAVADSYAFKAWREYETDPIIQNKIFEEKFDLAINSNKSAKDISKKLGDYIKTKLVDDGSFDGDSLPDGGAIQDGGVPQDGEISQDEGASWDGELIYIPTNYTQVVQIGKSTTNKYGRLIMPPLVGEIGRGQSLIFRAMRAPGTKKGELMPVFYVRGNETNDLALISLAKEWNYYDVPIGNLHAGDRIMFHSITNGTEGRVFLDGVWIGSGYEPGVWKTNQIEFVEGLTNTEYGLTNLIAGSYHWKVRSDVRGEKGIWSEENVVEIRESVPGGAGGDSGSGTGESGGSDGGGIPANEDYAAGAWRTSQIKNWPAVFDFSTVTNVTKGTNWENGVSIQGLYFFKNGVKVTNIFNNSRASTKGGLYASYTNNLQGTTIYSLSMLGTGDSDVTMVWPIINDNLSEKMLISAKIRYTAYQWTFKGEGGEERKLLVEYAVTDSIDRVPGADELDDCKELEFVSKQSLYDKDELDEGGNPRNVKTHLEESRELVLDGIEVPPGGVLWIRWRVEKKANNVMFGVGNLSISDVCFKELPTVIRLR